MNYDYNFSGVYTSSDNFNSDQITRSNTETLKQNSELMTIMLLCHFVFTCSSEM